MSESNNYARSILGLENATENGFDDKDNLVAKEDGMAYVRSLNRVRTKDQTMLEHQTLNCEINSISIANEAVMSDVILEHHRMDLIKDLMISENGISLESANDIMDSYMKEGKIGETAKNIGASIAALCAKIKKFIMEKSAAIIGWIKAKLNPKLAEVEKYYSANKMNMSQIIGEDKVSTLGKLLMVNNFGKATFFKSANAIIENLKKVFASGELNNTSSTDEMYSKMEFKTSNAYEESSYGKDMDVMEFISYYKGFLSESHIKNYTNYVNKQIAISEKIAKMFKMEHSKNASIRESFKSLNISLRAYATCVTEVQRMSGYMNQVVAKAKGGESRPAEGDGK